MYWLRYKLHSLVTKFLLMPKHNESQAIHTGIDRMFCRWQFSVREGGLSCTLLNTVSQDILTVWVESG